MKTAKHKHIELDIIPLSKAHNLSVSVTIPFACSAECVLLLLGNNPCESDKGLCNTLHHGSEESALAYALYKLVQEKLCGSPLEVARTKVDHVSCASHHNSFVISWNTQGTGSALRKTLGVVLKCLLPNALFSRYGHNMKVLGGKVDRSVFNHLANKMIDGLNKKIHFVAVGRIKEDTDFKSLLETACGKYSESKKSPANECQAPEKHSEHKLDWPRLKCSDGSCAVVLADYIQHKGIGLRVEDKEVVIYSRSWGSKREALKKSNTIASYVSAKYKKLDKLAGLFLAYYANSVALGDGHTIVQLSKHNDPLNIIKKNL
jgi:hypothetical protein